MIYLSLLLLSPLLFPDEIESEEFYFDTFHNKRGEEAIKQGKLILYEGETYSMKVSGTYSVWRGSYWTFPCGKVESNPMFKSKKVWNQKNAGLDMEFVYSAPNSGKCSIKELPYRHDKVQISLDGGINWFHPGNLIKEDFKSHKYEYQIEGKGYPLMIKTTDLIPDDNYGRLKIELNLIPNRKKEAGY